MVAVQKLEMFQTDSPLKRFNFSRLELLQVIQAWIWNISPCQTRPYFLDLLSTNHKFTQPSYFSPATQTCYSEGEDGLEFFDEEF
jgi:hypothetical protein